MSEPVTFPALALDFPTPPQGQVGTGIPPPSSGCFPKLLKTYRGKYVAIHEGRVVDSRRR